MVCIIPIYVGLRPLKRASSLLQYSYVATHQTSIGLSRHLLHPAYFVHARHMQLHLLASSVMHLNIGRGLSTKINCWKCGISVHTEDGNLFCGECNALQLPNKKLNHFNIIGVGENYDINTATMTRKYYQLQNILHPDRFSNKPTVSCCDTYRNTQRYRYIICIFA